MDAHERQTALGRARGGDSQALGALLESFRPYVRAVAQALRNGRLPNKVDDSDLIQDALLEAHRHFGDFRGTTVPELAGWLRQIVLRTVGHTLRLYLGTGKRAAAREQAGADLEALQADPGSSPSARAIRQEESARVIEALAHLPEDMQQVLLARHADDLSHAEIARRLGRSEAAVRVLYSRAVRRLREACS